MKRTIGILVFILAALLPVAAQSLSCGAPSVTYNAGKPTISFYCFNFNYTADPFTADWDTGFVAINPITAPHFTVTEYHGGQAITNYVSASLCNSDCSIRSLTTLTDSGPGTFTYSGSTGFTVSYVRVSGTFHVGNAFAACDPWGGSCYFQIDVALF